MAEKVHLDLNVYPAKMAITIDSIPITGKKRDLPLDPGTHIIKGYLNDTVAVEEKIMLHSEDRNVRYKVRGKKKNGGFRATLGGQWIFNNYDSGPFYYESMYIDSTLDTTEITYKKPFTFITLDLGYVTSKNFYFGAYGELFNQGGMFTFGKEWDLGERISLYVGGKIGILNENRNSFYTKEIPHEYSWKNYLYHGWPLDEDIDSSVLIDGIEFANIYQRLGSLDVQVTYGSKPVKLYIRGGAWVSMKNDYSSFTLYEYNDGDDIEIGYNFKYCFLPALSAGVQLNIEDKSSEVGIYGPYESKITQSSGEEHIPLSDQGNRWFGVSIAWGSYMSGQALIYSTIEEKVFALRTITRFYPMRNFILGPSVEMYRIGDKYNILAGGEIGCSFNVRNRFMPYAIANTQLGIILESSENPVMGISLSAKAGGLVKLSDKLGLYVEPEFNILNKDNRLSFHGGFSYSAGRNIFSMGSTLFPNKEVSGFGVEKNER